MNEKLEALRNVEQGALGLHAQMIVVKNLLNEPKLMQITKEDTNNVEVKKVMDSITSIFEDCNTIFTKDIY